MAINIQNLTVTARVAYDSPKTNNRNIVISVPPSETTDLHLHDSPTSVPFFTVAPGGTFPYEMNNGDVLYLESEDGIAAVDIEIFANGF